MTGFLNILATGVAALTYLFCCAVIVCGRSGNSDRPVAEPTIDPRSPTGRYLADEIGIAEMEALIGASVGVESDLKLVEELDPPAARMEVQNQDLLTYVLEGNLLVGVPIERTRGESKLVDIVISAEGVSVVMLEGDHRTIQPLDTMTCAQLDSIAKWLEIPNSEVMLKSELLSRISAELGFRS